MRTTLFLAAMLFACGGTTPKPTAPPTTTAPDGTTVADPVVTPSTPAAPPRTLVADETITTRSGATFTAAAGWQLREGVDLLTLDAPERDLSVTYVELEAASGRDAITAAWQLIRPGFALAVAQADDVPGRDGWDAMTQLSYAAPAAEQRTVIAAALGKGTLWRVYILDGKNAALSRRGAQAGSMIESLKAPGVTQESWAGKPANQLDATRLAAIDAFVEEALRTSDLPGAALAIVQGGKVIHERGYGVRERGKPGKIGPHTLFLTGSTGKSLVTLMMARAVDAKRFAWDTPVTTLLPSFALASAEVTQALTVRHTVCACTGMPRQDLEMFFGYLGVTAEQRIAQMKTMAPTTGFGETFQYSNFLVMAGGYAAAHALYPKLGLGAAFDKAMHEQVWKPLAMKDTTYDFKRAAKADHATPHARDLAGAVTAFPVGAEAWVSSVRPAGGQWSSVHDYARVLLLELGNGVLDGKRVVSEANLLERRKPQVKITDTQSYAMGLVVGTTSDVPIVTHNGGTIGFSTDYLWLPEHGVGLVVVTNTGGAGAFLNAVTRKAMEELFDATPRAADDLAQANARRARSVTEAVAQLAPAVDAAWFAPWVGAYTSPSLGRITLRQDGAHVVLDAGAWAMTLGQKTSGEGVRSLETTSVPFSGFEVFPEERNGRRVIVLRDEQLEYVFEPVAK